MEFCRKNRCCKTVPLFVTVKTRSIEHGSNARLSWTSYDDDPSPKQLHRSLLIFSTCSLNPLRLPHISAHIWSISIPL